LEYGIQKKATGTTFPLYKKERERRSRPTRTLTELCLFKPNRTIRIPNRIGLPKRNKKNLFRTQYSSRKWKGAPKARESRRRDVWGLERGIPLLVEEGAVPPPKIFCLTMVHAGRLFLMLV